MKKYKSITSFILTAAIILSCMTSYGATSWDTWDSSYVYKAGTANGVSMPFRPENGYVSKQNPPDFTWPYVEGGTYNLRVCTNKNMSNSSLKYSVKGLKANYYNFPETFETGRDYYWSVQYETATAVSVWSPARKFRIDVDAWDFTVPPISDIMARISLNHPRIYSADTPWSMYTLEEFRALKDKYTYAMNDYMSYINAAGRYVSENKIFTEPETPDTDPYPNPVNSNLDGAVTSNCTTVSRDACARMYNCAYAYMLSGNESYGNYAKSILLELSGWRYDRYSATGYNRQDQLFREVMYQGAITYDWIYPLLSDAEKTKILTMLENRMKFLDDIGLITRIKKLPYDSHGWTTIGFLAIAAYATIDEISLSRRWLEEIIPLYTAVMHPWSNQDGGWCQGLAYWSFSSGFSKELINILTLGGIINLYDKAWSKNEYLWNLYAWGPYTYASFGDGSAGYPYTTDALHAQKDMAYFTSNPVAKWIWQTNNSGKASGLEYFAAPLEELHSEAPTDYKLSHIFSDIGWVVMTNDLMSRNKVQLTFKSSPYGSFNHSHADQNSFFIQAYGKDLAIKSGYYDSYHTVHDKNFTRQSFAHNTITTDGGKGQIFDRFDASGKVSQFVYQMEMDSVTGNSTDAYFTAANPNAKFFDKNERSIVYLRPGIFVVIDTLDAAGSKESTYEWWLNAIDVENKGSSATITNGSVKLDAEVMYPENVTSQKYEGFVTPGGEYYPAYNGDSSVVEQNRISFVTPALSKTKMVVVMDVYDENNSETVNIVPKATVSPDKKYMTLDFGDIYDTEMIVKLTDDETPVVCGNIEFTGDAVTRTGNSIMLTNGYYLKYNGKTLIDGENNKVTVALGCDQLSLSSENDATIRIGTHSVFWKSTDVDSITDEKGRNVSENNLGIDLSYEDDIIYAEIEKGSYTLLKGADTAITPGQICPENICIRKDANGSAKIYWDGLSYVDYDISINGRIRENINSGFTLPKGDNTCAIMLRSRLGAEKGSWSAPIYYSRTMGDYISYVKYEEADGSIKATQYARSQNGLNFSTAVQGAGNALSALKTNGKKEGIFENTVAKSADTDKIYSYMWADNLAPAGRKSIFKSADMSLTGIYLDGELIEGFESSRDSYTAELAAEVYFHYPSVTAAAADASSRVSVKNADSRTNKAVITVEAGNGAKRSIEVNFVPGSDMHFVKGASKPEDFVNDGGTESPSSKVSSGNVGTISYTNSAGTLITKNLRLYTNFNDRQDGYFGARVSNDRSPNSANHMEMYYVDEKLKGYDYFVFGNDNVYKNNNADSLYTVEFDIDHSAEIIVLGKNFDHLLSEGFEKESKIWAKGRYMHVVGNEDIFYNITYRGKSFNDCVYQQSQKNYYMKNYDVMQDWVNVTPPEGCSSWSDDQYFANASELSEDMFTVVGNNLMSYTVDWSDMFTSAYTKRFYTDGTSTHISFDLTKLNQSTRAVIIVKPIETEDFVSRFEFLGPKAFEEIPSKLRRGYKAYSNAESPRAVLNCYENFKILNGFGNGSKAYVNSDDIISNFNDLCEIENAMYIPPFRMTGEGDGWINAYYYGMGEVSDDGGSYSLPALEGKSFDWYRFNLNCSSNIYVVSRGEKPSFIDDSWTKLNVGTKVFSVGGYDYTDLYAKYIDVEKGSSSVVAMPTKGSRDGEYYVFVKPVK